MQIKHLPWLCAAFITLMSPLAVHAQLVADGATATVNGIVVNITGNLTVGTNGSFTTLIITNGATVTNSGVGTIGYNGTSKTNKVIVTGANSSWGMSDNLNLGDGGSFNLLLVTNGGRVVNSYGNISLNTGSANNSAVVTGTNSLWTCNESLNIGNTGPFSQLVVSNGGAVMVGSVLNVGNGSATNQLTITGGGVVTSGLGKFGEEFQSIGNSARISGAGSRWIINGELDIGLTGSFNQLQITNGGGLTTIGGYLGANLIQDGIGNSNLVVVTDAGSTWTNTADFALGDSSAFNQLTVTNGGVVRNTGAGASVYLGFQPSGSNNTVLVTGTNSLFSSAGSAYVGLNGSSNQLVVNSGGTVAANNLYVGFYGSSSNNVITLGGGSLIVTNASATSITDVRRGSLTLNAGLLVANHLWLTNAAQGKLIFNGGTLQTQNTTNNNGAPFVVGNGTTSATLELLGSGSHNFASGLQIASNGLLKGNGTIIGNVTNASGGTLSPGSSIGRFTLSGKLVLAAGSTNVFELNKTLGTNDNIIGLTNVIYGGTLIASNLSGMLTNGDSFKLFSASTYIGAFSSIVPTTPGAGLRWNTNGLTSDGALRVANVPTIPPAASKITLPNGTNVIITVSGGVAYDPVFLLTATNLTTPAANWISLLTNYFNASGGASFTNTITPGQPQRYFRLKVN